VDGHQFAAIWTQEAIAIVKQWVWIEHLKQRIQWAYYRG
jgi:hypothetical protein